MLLRFTRLEATVRYSTRRSTMACSSLIRRLPGPPLLSTATPDAKVSAELLLAASLVCALSTRGGQVERSAIPARGAIDPFVAPLLILAVVQSLPYKHHRPPSSDLVLILI